MYNGWKNWAHWNVALWILNDEGLYGLALDVVRNHKTQDAAARAMLAELHDMGVTKTPDGARYSVSALRAALSSLK